MIGVHASTCRGNQTYPAGRSLATCQGNQTYPAGRTKWTFSLSPSLSLNQDSLGVFKLVHAHQDLAKSLSLACDPKRQWADPERRGAAFRFAFRFVVLGTEFKRQSGSKQLIPRGRSAPSITRGRNAPSISRGRSAPLTLARAHRPTPKSDMSVLLYSPSGAELS